MEPSSSRYRNVSTLAAKLTFGAAGLLGLRLVFVRLVAAKADGVGDVVKFLTTDVFEALAGGRKFLVDLDGFLGHDLVRLLGTAGEDEIRAGRYAFVAI